MAKKVKKLGTFLLVWTILGLVGNSVGLLMNLGASVFIGSILPDFPVWTLFVGGLIAIANIIFLINVFFFKRWAIYGIGAAAVVMFIINIISSLEVVSIIFSVLGLIAPGILVWAASWQWKDFV